jgi:hypothetical protein
VIHYDNIHQGFPRIRIANKTLDGHNIYIYFGRLCPHQEKHETDGMA